jgi:DNA repair protein RadC
MRIENGPRERLLNEGAQSLTTEELIAIILRTGTRDRDVLAVSKELFEKHERSLYKMSKATIEDLRKFKGLGKVKAVTLLAALEIAKRLVKEEVKLTSPTLNSPEQVFQYCIDMQTFPQEVVRVLFLDSKLRLIGSSDISKGTLTTSIANPRDIFREALIRNAHGIIIVHNHPSGDSTPSEDDVEITKRLIKAGGVLNIKVLDHVVIGRTFCSIIQKFRNLL